MWYNWIKWTIKAGKDFASLKWKDNWCVLLSESFWSVKSFHPPIFTEICATSGENYYEFLAEIPHHILFSNTDYKMTPTDRLRHCRQLLSICAHNSFSLLWNLSISIVYSMKEAWLPQGHSQCRRSVISMLRSTRWEIGLLRATYSPRKNGILEAFGVCSKFRTMCWRSREYRFHRFRWFLILSNELWGSHFLFCLTSSHTYRKYRQASTFILALHIHTFLPRLIIPQRSNLSRPLTCTQSRTRTYTHTHAHSLIFSPKQLV